MAPQERKVQTWEIHQFYLHHLQCHLVACHLLSTHTFYDECCSRRWVLSSHKILTNFFRFTLDILKYARKHFTILTFSHLNILTFNHLNILTFNHLNILNILRFQPSQQLISLLEERGGGKERKTFRFWVHTSHQSQHALQHVPDQPQPWPSYERPEEIHQTYSTRLILINPIAYY